MQIKQHGRRSGSILVVALVFAGLVGLMLVAYLSMVDSQHRFTHRSEVWNNCIPLCEAGLEEALAHLNHSATTGTNFALNGWVLDAGAYRKERTLNGGLVRMEIDQTIPPTITVTGYLRAPLQAHNLSRTVRIKTKLNERFPYALLAKGKISMSGASTTIDSFDSSKVTESTGGRYDPLKRTDRATVATVSRVAGDLDVNDASIYGRVGTGPGGGVKISGGVVGSTLWNTNPLNDGRIEPSRYANDVNVPIPDGKLPAPFTPMPPGPGVVSGTNYAYVLQDGDYRISQINLGGSDAMIITGNARIHVQGQTSISGSARILLADGARVEWYAGGDLNVSGQGLINSPGLASHFAVIGLNTCGSVNYSGQAQFIGTIYAPRSNVTLSGNTSATGSIVGGEITLSGDMSFHFDEALKGDTDAGRFIAASWMEL